MTVSVLEHVEWDSIPDEWRRKAGVESQGTFKVIFVRDDEQSNDVEKFNEYLKGLATTNRDEFLDVSIGDIVAEAHKKAGVTG